MKHKQHFTSGLRVGNFSSLALPLGHVLEIPPSQEIASIVKIIRTHADLPFVFIVSRERSAQAAEVLAALKAIRSPCLPYALFLLPGAEPAFAEEALPIIRLGSDDGDDLRSRVAAFAAERLRFDESRLRVGSAAAPPESVDVAIIGGGILGLYAAHRLKQGGLSFCVAEKADKVGGIWSSYANATSRVNSSECAYRLFDSKPRSNRDHSSTREILEDIAGLAAEVSDRIFLRTAVEKIEKEDAHYLVRYRRNGLPGTLRSKGVILAINDRVGAPREIAWPGQARFKGEIVPGFADGAARIDWRDKKVVVVGMGAFAVENVRTALEGGASHVTVVGRRHGTVCPKIIDYLNFVTPYDEAYKHDKKSNFRNMLYWKKTYELSGATEPECWMGKAKHDGHTISVSDIWFVGHYLKKIRTVTGELSGLYDTGVIAGDQRIEADIVVNCIGFTRNASVARAICGYTEMYTNNYLDKDFIYLADAHIDDDAFNSFFGSSVLEMAKFYMEIYIQGFDSPRFAELIAAPGIGKIPVEDRKWSHYIAAASSLIRHNPEIAAIARQQVAGRTHNFLEKHDIETYVAENKREWLEMHAWLSGKPVKEENCLPYLFEKLLPDRSGGR